MFLSASTQWLAVTSQRPSFTRRLTCSSRSGRYFSMMAYTLAWLWLKMKPGCSSMSRSTVVTESTVTETVSGHDHIQFMSMCAWPTQYTVNARAAGAMGAMIPSARRTASRSAPPSPRSAAAATRAEAFSTSPPHSRERLGSREISSRAKDAWAAKRSRS